MKITSLFFMLISFLLGVKALRSEIPFLIKLAIGLAVLGLTTLAVFLYLKNIKDLILFKKRLLTAFFLALAFFCLRYIIGPKTITPDLEESLSAGPSLFYIYLPFLLLLDLDLTINNLLALLSFLLIPILVLAKFNYTSETFAVFGFLVLIVSCLQIARSSTKYEPA